MTEIKTVLTTPVLIVGSGVAGLTTALNAGECTVVTSGTLGATGSTPWSQGGIAAAVDPQDSAGSHAADTVKVSDGLTESDVVKLVTAGGADAIAWLQGIGASFDESSGGLDLGKEAGHSHRRIVKSNGDSIGKLLSATLSDATRQANDVSVIENHQAISLAITEDGSVCGALLQDADGAENLTLVLSTEVVLATGGYGYLWEKTTNPSGSIGSGIYLAGSVGAELADLEFVQFHPTALDVESPGRLPLLTEAIRGEGAHLLNSEQDRYMLEVHADAELAPRDVVARANYTELIEGRRPSLDATEVSGGAFASHFPGVNQIAIEHGFAPSVDALPITPAAHYCMGGVIVDELGKTSIKGLRAVGEVTRSGLHGANRLASNSLLEGLVMGRRIGQELSELDAPKDCPEVVRVIEPMGGNEQVQLEDSLKSEMWRNVGLVRNEVDLKSACVKIEEIWAQTESQRLRVMTYVAKLVAEQAWGRKESRGAHYRSDSVTESNISSKVVTAPIELMTIPTS